MDLSTEAWELLDILVRFERGEAHESGDFVKSYEELRRRGLVRAWRITHEGKAILRISPLRKSDPRESSVPTPFAVKPAVTRERIRSKKHRPSRFSQEGHKTRKSTGPDHGHGA